MTPERDISAEELRSTWGTPEQVPAGPVLRLLGYTEAEIHASEGSVVAHRYPSMEACKAFADGNQRHHGHTSSSIETADGVFGITRLNPGLLA